MKFRYLSRKQGFINWKRLINVIWKREWVCDKGENVGSTPDNHVSVLTGQSGPIIRSSPLIRCGFSKKNRTAPGSTEGSRLVPHEGPHGRPASASLGALGSRRSIILVLSILFSLPLRKYVVPCDFVAVGAYRSATHSVGVSREAQVRARMYARTHAYTRERIKGIPE